MSRKSATLGVFIRAPHSKGTRQNSLAATGSCCLTIALASVRLRCLDRASQMGTISTTNSLLRRNKMKNRPRDQSMDIRSIQVGRVVTEGDPESREVTTRLWSSAFRKTPVTHPVQMTPMGIVGDEVANTRDHGGVDKAVLCYSLEHYTTWPQEHPELLDQMELDRLGLGAFEPGAFGENLTLSSQSESNVCIGDRYAIGDGEIEVSQPRQPCWKIARRWGMKWLPKEVGQKGRTGWYVRVTRSGMIQAGNQLTLVSRPHPRWTVSRANDVLMGREVDRMAVIELMSLRELADAWKDSIA